MSKPPEAAASAAAAAAQDEPVEDAPAEDAATNDPGFADEMTEQAQMDAIRERIEARRDQLRNEQKSQPPADSP